MTRKEKIKIIAIHITNLEEGEIFDDTVLEVSEWLDVQIDSTIYNLLEYEP